MPCEIIEIVYTSREAGVSQWCSVWTIFYMWHGLNGTLRQKVPRMAKDLETNTHVNKENQESIYPKGKRFDYRRGCHSRERATDFSVGSQGKV